MNSQNSSTIENIEIEKSFLERIISSGRQRVDIYMYMIFIIAPYADLITGFLVTKGTFSESFLGSPSQLLRGGLFLFSFFFFVKKDIKIVFFFIIYFLSVEILSFFSHRNVTGLLTGIVVSYKLIFAVSFFCVAKRSILDGKLTLSSFSEFALRSGRLYGIGIIVPFILGIGTPTYSEGAFGTKGFFASGNGLGIYLGILSVLCFFVYRSAWRLNIIVSYVVVFISLALLGTKAAMIFIALNLFLWFITMKGVFRVLVIIIIAAILVKFQEGIVNAFAVIYDVVIFRYNKSESFLQFLFSGRDQYVKDAFAEYNLSFPLFYRSLFGSGSFLSFRDPSTPVPVFDTLETDFFDVFFMYGCIGVLGYIFVIFRYMAKAWRRNFLLFTFFLAAAIHSLIAGHVLFNGMSAMGLITLMIFIDFYVKRSVWLPGQHLSS